MPRDGRQRPKRRHPPPTPYERCAATGKVIYADRDEAEQALVDVRNRVRRTAGRAPRRAYPCDDCDRWHLTALTGRQWQRSLQRRAQQEGA